MTLLDWLTVTAAFTAEQLVDVPADAPGWWAVLGGAAWTLFAFALRRAWVWLQARSAARRNAAAAGIAFVAATLPLASTAALAWLGLRTACGGEGASPEALLLAALRGMLCAMLAVGTTESESRSAVMVTLFIVVLAAIVNDHPATAVINAGYAAVAASSLAARATGAPRPAGSRTLPGPVGLVSCLTVTATVSMLGGSRDACGRAVVGWLPLSGGDSHAFPWARDGVGDGENLVAAKKDPRATGPVNSGVFATSHKSSLYDLFNDLYGDPPKPKRDERKRAVSLGPEELPPTDRHLADSEHAGREFSTVRKASARSRRPRSDLAARALVTLAGPAPVHLRMAVFDSFDGRAWRVAPSQIAAADSRRLEHAGGDWMRWHGVREPSARPASDLHAITIGSMQTSVLPLPARADMLRLDRIDRPDFFRMPADDVVALDGIDTPAGTTVHTQSLAGGVDATGAIGVVAAPAVDVDGRAAAPSWTTAVLEDWRIDHAAGAAGWPHVARVVAEIQRRLVRDDTALPPDDCADTLRHALTVSHRGRPYDFAGAAAILLRACGYETRVVGGLHVSGQRRDVRSRRLVATADDAHVWAEIRDVSGRWIPLEPTPEYRLRRPTLPWTARVGEHLREAAAWASGRVGVIATTVAVSILVAAGVLLGWRRCVDAVVTAWWRRSMQRGTDCPLQATWHLIAWRSWLAGCPKRSHETLRDWHRRVVSSTALGPRTTPFLSCFERAAYGRSGPPTHRSWDRHVAESAGRLVTVGRLRTPAVPRAARTRSGAWLRQALRIPSSRMQEAA
ncbi:MAG: transglutaminase domain-containing protein [Planctomycetaceae bacterium]